MRLNNWAFRECSLVEVDFSHTDLTGSDFYKSDLRKALFDHTILAKAHLEAAYNYSINLETNRLRGAFFSLPEAASLLIQLGIKLVDNPTA